MSPTSIRITALLSYASQNDVSPIGVLAVVLYAHSTLGNSSGHISFTPSSRVLMILNKDWFVTSTCPLEWGWAGRSSGFWFPIMSKSPWKSLSHCLLFLLYHLPLSSLSSTCRPNGWRWYLSHQHFPEVFGDSCKAEKHCSEITFSLMRPES